VLALIALGLVAWWGLGFFVSGSAERCYLLVPPASVILAMLWQGWASLKGALRRLALRWFTATVVTGLFGILLTQMAGLPVSRIWPEVCFFSCLVTAVFLVLLGLQVLLQRLAFKILAAGSHNAPGKPLCRWRNITARILALAFLAGVTVPYLMALMYVFRFKIPNVPDPQLVTGRPYDDVAFKTEDGLTLRGWFFPSQDPRSGRTVLICHGLGLNRSAFLAYLRVGEALRANVLLFDFRGHGDSDGHTVTLGNREKLDVLAAVRYLRTERAEQARELIGLGISMGAASLTRAAACVEPPLDAVILDSGFASVVDLTDNILAPFPSGLRPWLTAVGIPLASLHAGCSLPDVRPEEAIGSLRAPVLIIHGNPDELIPTDHARRLFAHAGSPKELWLAPTEGHCSALAGACPQYLQAIWRLVGPARTDPVLQKH
jgi:pimeloyl-ACP methyl ester carboxylesterase